MEIIYKYLFADLGLGLIWLILFLKKRNLRKEMLFGGILYSTIITSTVLIVYGLSHFFEMTWRYVPDYFNPDTLFNLSRIASGLAIEDVLFMFFAGGIISILYEVLFKKKVIVKVYNKHHFLSIFGFYICYVVIALTFKFNVIYNLIISSIFGFLIIILQRKDLFKHAIYGAFAFTLLYLILGILFVLIFPETVTNFWNLDNISGINIFGFPIEELLYAFSFGLMWAPMYEYLKGYKI